MTNILSVEFFRLKKSKLFWALFGVTAGFPLIIMLLFVAMIGFLSLFEQDVSINMWDLMRSLNLTAALLSGHGSVMHFSSLMAVICSSIFLSREFAYGTVRNILTANRSRAELYLSHIIVAVTIGTSFLGVSILSTLLFSGSVFGFYELNAAEVFTAIATAFAMGVASMLFAQSMSLMFLFGTRKLAVALACTIVICLVAPSTLSSIVSVLQILQGAATGELNTDMSWVPLYNSSLLDVSAIDGKLIGKILLYLLPLTALFGTIGWLTFRKADLK